MGYGGPLGVGQWIWKSFPGGKTPSLQMNTVFESNLPRGGAAPRAETLSQGQMGKHFQAGLEKRGPPHFPTSAPRHFEAAAPRKSANRKGLLGSHGNASPPTTDGDFKETPPRHGQAPGSTKNFWRNRGAAFVLAAFFSPPSDRQRRGRERLAKDPPPQNPKRQKPGSARRPPAKDGKNHRVKHRGSPRTGGTPKQKGGRPPPATRRRRKPPPPAKTQMGHETLQK